MNFMEKYDMTEIVRINGIAFAYSKKIGKVFVMSSSPKAIHAISGKLEMTLEDWEDETKRRLTIIDELAKVGL